MWPDLNILTAWTGVPIALEVADVRELNDLPTDVDLVAISSFSAQVREGYELARQFRAKGVPVVMGGLHVTSLPRETIDVGASAMVGEGELLWPEILADAERGALKPLYDARGREFGLADAPMPAFELLDRDRYNRITVQTSRGCPWRCAFCDLVSRLYCDDFTRCRRDHFKRAAKRSRSARARNQCPSVAIGA